MVLVCKTVGIKIGINYTTIQSTYPCSVLRQTAHMEYSREKKKKLAYSFNYNQDWRLYIGRLTATIMNCFIATQCPPPWWLAMCVHFCFLLPHLQSILVVPFRISWNRLPQFLIGPCCSSSVVWSRVFLFVSFTSWHYCIDWSNQSYYAEVKVFNQHILPS